MTLHPSKEKARSILKRAVGYLHLAYFALVAVESGHLYGVTAGVLGLAILTEICLGESV